jgi:putative ABC transport system permease protein
MARIREWLLRFVGTLTGRRSDRDLERELRSHLELAADAMQTRQRGPEEALRAAHLRHGGVVQAMLSMRNQRGLPWVEDAVIDLRHSLRAFRRSPVFAAIAIVTLALGIGANTAILSIVNGVLLRPLAYPRPEQLMHLTTTGERPLFPASVPEYLEFRQFTRAFADVGAFRTADVNLAVGDRAQRLPAAFVDAHLLKTLGLEPPQGRLFTVDDDVVTGPRIPGGSAPAAPVALVSYELWQSVFGGAPLLGNGIDVDGRRLHVVGVMPRDADLMDAHVAIWLPLGFTQEERLARNNHNLTLIGRLKNDVSLEEAQAEMRALTETWSARTGLTPGGPDHPGHVFQPPAQGRSGHTLQITSLEEQILGRAGRSIWVLQAAVALVLLIACGNVANLLMVRAQARQREFSVLSALGADRGRLVRKVLTENVILATTGGALGVALARPTIIALIRAYPATLPRIDAVTVDARVMLVSLGVAVACGLLFGLAPIVHARSATSTDSLKSGERGTSRRTRDHIRRGLVIAQTALAFVVVAGAVLLARTVHNLASVDVGFDRTRLVTFSITLPPASFDQMSRVRAYQRVLENVRAVPGVAMATAMTGLPLDRPALINQTQITTDTAASGIMLTGIDYQRVMSGFFQTLGVPIVQGRGFEPGDVGSKDHVVVINESMANAFWRGRNPIGQRLRPGGTMPWLTIVGVARNVKQTDVTQSVRPEAYALVDQVAVPTFTSFLSISPTTMNVVVKTALPLAALAPMLDQVVRNVDPSVPMARLRDMEGVFAESIGRSRLLSQLVGAFAGFALLLAAIGIHGVLAYLVAESRRDVAIRIALGAERTRVLRSVMTHGVRWTAMGLAIGLAAAVAVNRLLTSLLFEIEPSDPTTLVAVAVAITTVAALASWLPAWRASRLDPNVVLRTE